MFTADLLTKSLSSSNSPLKSCFSRTTVILLLGIPSECLEYMLVCIYPLGNVPQHLV